MCYAALIGPKAAAVRGDASRAATPYLVVVRGTAKHSGEKDGCTLRRSLPKSADVLRHAVAGICLVIRPTASATTVPGMDTSPSEAATGGGTKRHCC
jgi:hypothetical protein